MSEVTLGTLYDLNRSAMKQQKPLDPISFNRKTKEMVKMLEELKIADKKVLIVINELDENVILAGRNLQNIFMMEPYELNVLDIINADYILADVAAIKTVEEALK